MWISGRRALRPDRQYYRSVRRARLREGTRSRAREIGPGVVIAAAVAMMVLAWLYFRV